eukprot:COSAG02_NODE_362_length_23815_cov_27.096981_6_plen_237_part_00
MRVAPGQRLACSLEEVVDFLFAGGAADAGVQSVLADAAVRPTGTSPLRPAAAPRSQQRATQEVGSQPVRDDPGTAPLRAERIPGVAPGQDLGEEVETVAPLVDVGGARRGVAAPATWQIDISVGPEPCINTPYRIETVAGLKRKVADVSGVPEEESFLTAGGKLLEIPSRRLDELGIGDCFTIDQQARIRGGANDEDAALLKRQKRILAMRSCEAILGTDYDDIMRRIVKLKDGTA